MWTKFFLFAMLHISSAVLYDWNGADYSLMPPIFLLDDYEQCLQDPEGLYCTAEFAAVSDEPSALLILMQKYSKHIPPFYNHTNLHRGVCITQTCKKFYEKSAEDLGPILEACANETLHNEYRLKAKVSNGFACSKREKNQPLDYVDIFVGVVCVAILVMNIVASIYDYFFGNSDSGGLRFIYCFSVLRNFNKLMSLEQTNPRLEVFRGLHGIRTLNMILVIAGHSTVLSVFLTENTALIEDIFTAEPFLILANGTVIMQTFLLISSFLLVFMMLIHSEKHKLSWKMIPQQIFLRWLRLTPSYALILALTATWFGRLTSGPYWKKNIGNEMSDCRRYWWMHLLYVNNYYDKSECMGQSWYLAVDFQLSCLAAVVFVMCRTPRSRKVVLSLLFVLGLVVPPLVTYYRNLDGVLKISPELALNMCQNSRTFDEVYKRTHTNLTGYVLGMAAGYWFYDWQKAGSQRHQLRKYRFLYWTLFPLGVFCCYSGNIFYRISAAPSFTVNLFFATFLKPIFAIIICLIIVGVVVQFEDVYRPILEWPGWTVPSRLSFSAYLLHVVFLRNYMAMQTTTYKLSMVFLTKFIIIVVYAFISAFIFWILVEGPFRNLIEEYFRTPKPVNERKQYNNTSSNSKDVSEKEKEDDKNSKKNK